jgi:hypothetical protein
VGRKPDPPPAPPARRVDLVAIRHTVAVEPLPEPPRGSRWIGIVTDFRTDVPVDMGPFGNFVQLAGNVRHSARVEFCLEPVRRRRRRTDRKGRAGR